MSSELCDGYKIGTFREREDVFFFTGSGITIHEVHHNDRHRSSLKISLYSNGTLVVLYYIVQNLYNGVHGATFSMLCITTQET